MPQADQSPPASSDRNQPTTYDSIGATYSAGRRTDARWMAAIDQALADATSIIKSAQAPARTNRPTDAYSRTSRP